MKTNRERLREIVTVLASYGFGHIYRTRLRPSKHQTQDAANLRKAFEELGPTFIKFGQIISTRRDLLPQDYIDELSKLRDSAPSFSFDYIEETFKEEFDQELDEVFEWVEKEPLASASVSQVHKAKLKSGEIVILKSQRPDMEENLLRDIRLFTRIVKLAPATFKEMLVDADAALAEIEQSTKIELDFRNEAKAMNRFSYFNRDVEVIDSPEPYLRYASKRVLVMEYVDGIKNLNETKLIEAGYDRRDIAEKLLYSFLSQVFEDGYFHGDPHQGNMIIRDKKIVFIDFGIVGVLSDSVRENLIKFLRAIVFEDLEQLMNMLIQMTVSSKEINRFELREDLNSFFYTYVNRSLNQIDLSQIFSDILDITHKHSLVMPNDFIMLAKSLTMIEGIVSDLHEDINVMEIAMNYVKGSDDFRLFEKISKEKLGIGLYRWTQDAVLLPSSLRHLLDLIGNGHLKMHINLDNIEEKWTGINKMMNRLIFALIIASLVLSSSIITVVSTGSGLSLFGIIVFIGAGIMGIWLLISIIRSGNL